MKLRFLLTVIAGAVAFASPGAMWGQSRPPSNKNEGAARSLTLSEALALALERSPQLAGARAEVEALQGASRQAGMPINPEIGVIGENLGNSQLEGVDGPATTLLLSQRIELGGKRTLRARAAALAVDVADLDREAAQRSVRMNVARDYVDALVAEERQALAKEGLSVAQRVTQTVARRVQAGKASPSKRPGPASRQPRPA